ncbi:MAG: TonB-dependent receptor plug domain-containing protein, partial [Bacteroidales bacterium]|nr:TonB-dependent receptor plug domain-containing protein [Bacteroidales bacterium]
MRKAKFFLTVLSLFAVCSVWAQNITVKGTVSDAADKLPLIGAGVQVKGNLQGATTDIDGQFTISCDANATLVISYVGYKSQEVAVNNKSIVNVMLQADSESLEEVVLTAYGPQSKKSFTGTASVVKADQIKNLNVSSVSKALQGLASGVMVVSGTGQPGENATIRIRGVGSYSGSNEPLIVVDGVVYNGNMNSINPNDIESFTVLKDANSTALYGSRAANG